MMNQNRKDALHAVIVPFPAQGHVNALMNLAQLLGIRGVFVTFVNTEWIHKRMVEASTKVRSPVSKEDLGSEQQEWRIRFRSIPDGLPDNHGRTSSLTDLILSLQKLGPALEDLLTSAHEKSPSFPPITFIITDPYMSCTEEVASNMKVPRVIFWPLCAAASISQRYASLLASQGHIPANGKYKKGQLLFLN